MSDINSAILSMTQNTLRLGSSGATGEMGEASEGQGSEFTSVLASSLIDRQAAQSGNQLPQSGEREADTGHDDTRPLLRNLRLQSGLQIVVDGTVPSEAGLSAFAQSQGIDPAVLENLLDDHGRGAATNAGHTAGLIQPQGPVNTDAAEALTKEQLREQLGRMSPVGKEAGAQLVPDTHLTRLTNDSVNIPAVPVPLKKKTPFCLLLFPDTLLLLPSLFPICRSRLSFSLQSTSLLPLLYYVHTHPSTPTLLSTVASV